MGPLGSYIRDFTNLLLIYNLVITNLLEVTLDVNKSGPFLDAFSRLYGWVWPSRPSVRPSVRSSITR